MPSRCRRGTASPTQTSWRRWRRKSTTKRQDSRSCLSGGPGSRKSFCPQKGGWRFDFPERTKGRRRISRTYSRRGPLKLEKSSEPNVVQASWNLYTDLTLTRSWAWPLSSDLHNSRVSLELLYHSWKPNQTHEKASFSRHSAWSLNVLSKSPRGSVELLECTWIPAISKPGVYWNHSAITPSHPSFFNIQRSVS